MVKPLQGFRALDKSLLLCYTSSILISWKEKEMRKFLVLSLLGMVGLFASPAIASDADTAECLRNYGTIVHKEQMLSMGQECRKLVFPLSADIYQLSGNEVRRYASSCAGTYGGEAEISAISASCRVFYYPVSAQSVTQVRIKLPAGETGNLHW